MEKVHDRSVGQYYDKFGTATHAVKFVKDLTFRTENQKKWYDILSAENNIIMCHAVAGVGKTHITLWKALEYVLLRKHIHNKIIVINPTVDVGGESPLGFLPGDLDQKIAQYNESSYYILCKLIGEDEVRKLIEKGKLEFRALNFMRGLNLESAIILLDEAQNASPRQLKTLMTRIDQDSKLIIQGDLGQCDRYRDYTQSGFYDVWHKLKGVTGVEYMEFTPEDVIRSKIVKDVLARYAKQQNIILNGFH